MRKDSSAAYILLFYVTVVIADTSFPRFNVRVR